MNKLAITWAALKGFLNPFGSVFDSVATYVLERVNAALNAIDVGKKEKVQAALNVAQKALAVLTSLKWLCPVKWQTAYEQTIAAVATVCEVFSGLHLTIEDLSKLRTMFEKAYVAWQSPDDETCVDERELAEAA